MKKYPVQGIQIRISTLFTFIARLIKQLFSDIFSYKIIKVFYSYFFTLIKISSRNRDFRNLLISES